MADKAEKTAPVVLTRDYWGAEDVRTKAGEKLDLPVAEAKRLIAAGVALRADPLPGE